MSNVTPLRPATEPQAPINPLCANNHPNDTVVWARQVLVFLQDAFPSQVKEDDPTSASEGIETVRTSR